MRRGGSAGSSSTLNGTKTQIGRARLQAKKELAEEYINSRGAFFGVSDQALLGAIQNFASSPLFIKAHPSLAVAFKIFVAENAEKVKELLRPLLDRACELLNAGLLTASTNPSALQSQNLNMQKQMEHAVVVLRPRWRTLLEPTVATALSEGDASARLWCSLMLAQIKNELLDAISALLVDEHVAPPTEPDHACAVFATAELEQLYYISGWLLCSLKKYLKRVIHKRQWHARALEIVRHNTLSAAEAKAAGLPTALVDARTRGGLLYPSGLFFDMLKKVEHIYRSNLTFANVVARAATLIMRIEKLVLDSIAVRCAFRALLPDGDELDDGDFGSFAAVVSPLLTILLGKQVSPPCFSGFLPMLISLTLP